jgi:M6 family metalloprotease-like protein
VKKLLIGLVSLSVLLVGFVPAQAAGEYVARQKTLSGFSGSTTTLTSALRAEVKQAVDENPYAEKFICTGIRLEGQPMSLNVVVRKRAKAACDYAKQLNPALSTWFQNKPTKAASYNGKVLLTLKVPADKADAVPAGYVETEAIDWKINPDYKVGKVCGGGFGWQVLGLNSSNQPAYLICSNPNGGKFKVDSRMVKFDSATKKPLVPENVPAKTLFGYSPNLYIVPQIVDSAPKTAISAGAFDDYAQCKIAEVNDGSPDKSFGFPLPDYRAKLSSDFKILVIPVQFTDHKTSNRPADDMADVVSAMSNFYSRAASVPIKFNWTIPETYFKMGKSIKSYNLGYEFDGTGNFWKVYQPYLQDVIDLVDDQFDFSAYDAVVVEEPRSVTDAEHGMYIPHAPGMPGKGGLYSDEGQIMSLLVTGNDQSRDISNWIHEFGHLLGLPDRNWNMDINAGFDLMWGWYGAPEFSVWSRWQLEILQDSQVDCKTDTATSTHWLRPVAWTGDHQKAVVIPVSDHEVIVVESRRRQGYDALLGKESEGAYVYRVDTSAKMYQPDTKKVVDVIAPKRVKLGGGWAMDASLKLGESVTSDGWTITVKETGAFGDVVEVKKN